MEGAFNGGPFSLNLRRHYVNETVKLGEGWQFVRPDTVTEVDVDVCRECGRRSHLLEGVGVPGAIGELVRVDVDLGLVFARVVQRRHVQYSLALYTGFCFPPMMRMILSSLSTFINLGQSHTPGWGHVPAYDHSNRDPRFSLLCIRLYAASLRT
jgi:hypothetical protein